MTDTYHVRVVGPIRYAERKDGGDFKVAHYQFDSSDIAKFLLDTHGGGYSTSQVAKTMIANSDLERDGKVKYKYGKATITVVKNAASDWT